MRLVLIPRDGNVSLSGIALPEVATSVIASTVQLYERRGYVEPWVGHLAVEGGNCVGSCGIYFTYPFKKHGIVTRMAQCLISIARECNPSVRIIAHTLTEENASTQILKKFGFAFNGTIDHPEDGKIWEWSYELKFNPG